MADTEETTIAQDEGQGGAREDASFVGASVAQPVAMRDTITLQLFEGSFTYVLPFEPCVSYEAMTPVIVEIFQRLAMNDLLDHIRNGAYDFATVDGFIILPSLWKSFVKPGSTIQILFRTKSPSTQSSGSRSASRYRRRRPSPRREPSNDEDWYPTEKRSASPVFIRIENTRQPPTLSSDTTSQISDSDVDEESEEEEDEDDQDAEPRSPEPVRIVIPALDADGNALTYGKNTARAWNHRPSNMHGPKNEVVSQGTNQLTGANTESGIKYPPPDILRITRSVVTAQDNRSMIEVHILPTPELPRLQDAVSVTWYSITSDRLDYGRFKDACLTVPSMSARRKDIVGELLRRVEKDRVKAFLDGMFIEPGTILRVDEQGQSDPESAIFSCLPYFDVGPAPKKSSANSVNRLFPVRTLMQSYYPFEPVRDRDAEQAYKKFGNDQLKRLIQVPNLWIMNVSSDLVITYGHRPLTQEMIKSIAIIHDDLRPTNSGARNQEASIHVRITDPDARVFMFPLSSCESYFQLEQKVFELRCSTAVRRENSHVRIKLRSQAKAEEISPRYWRHIVGRNEKMYIDVEYNEEKKKPKNQMVMKITQANITEVDDLATVVSAPHNIPPVFAWPTTESRGESMQSDNQRGIIQSETQRTLQCLDKIEKSLLSETLLVHDTKTAVDKTFSSTAYYQSLSECTWELVKSELPKLAKTRSEDIPTSHHSTHHECVVRSQCADIGRKCTKFIVIVHLTLGLFVKDVDKNTFMRKIWGAMAKLQQKVLTIEQREPVKLDEEKEIAWFIRNASNRRHVRLPEAGRSLRSTMRHCDWCKEDHAYDSSEEAVKHLQDHVMTMSQRRKADGETPSTSDLLPSSVLQDWVTSHSQRKREETNAGTLLILNRACVIAAEILADALDLTAGVQNADDSMSKLYTLPPRLMIAFRQIIVFYLASERALHFTEESFQNDSLLEARYDEWSLPYSDMGLEVLQRFGDDAKTSLRISRHQLCHMVRSDPPIDIKCLSLTPEYVCAWLMRRLIVKPLERRMTIGDMYREYLSTIQFQVNHRPGKRLLRDINLLQEELNILLEINSWQNKLIDNYTRVLNDNSYEKDIPYRRANFPFEQALLQSCQDTLSLAQEDFIDLIRRCGPLSDKTKQSLEINEEDHGKAIMVFTIVTVIFLPLSFVTSYLGMNTTDIRDMGSDQSLFYIIAIPLTAATVGACLLIGYNGDELRDFFSSIYRSLIGKEDRTLSARGISVAQRKRARQLGSDSNSTLDIGSLADEAEFASPQQESRFIGYNLKNITPGYQQTYVDEIEPVVMEETYKLEQPMLKTANPVYGDEERPIRARPEFDKSYMPPLRSDYRTRARYNTTFLNPSPYVRPAPIYGDEDEREGYTWYKKGSARRRRAQEPYRRR